jgi:hypothetical protein
MKRLFSLLILFLIAISPEIKSQSPGKDFVIVGLVSGDLNMVQIKMRYEGAPNVYFIRESSTSGVEQIADVLAGLKINDLHIYARCSSNELLLAGLPISLENVNDFTAQLKRWKVCVSGKVIVHIESITTSPEINNLLIKMGELTALDFKVLQ